MTLRDLGQLFERRGVPRAMYSLTGGLPNEAYAIERAGDLWHVYYSERGQRTDLLTFASEADACELLAGWVLRYASSAAASSAGASDAEPSAAGDRRPHKLFPSSSSPAAAGP